MPTNYPTTEPTPKDTGAKKAPAVPMPVCDVWDSPDVKARTASIVKHGWLDYAAAERVAVNELRRELKD